MGEVQKFAMYESVNPWGPWYTIEYLSAWGSFGTSFGLWYSINPKWISADGKTFWMSFSGGSDGSVTMDAFHLVKGTFTLSGGATPSGGGTESYSVKPVGIIGSLLNILGNNIHNKNISRRR
jgi:hypothetical protein